MRTTKLARKPDHVAPAADAERLRKKCPCGLLTAGGGQCAACKKHDDEGSVLRKKSVGAGPATAPPVVGEVLRGSGQSLPAGVRSAVEPGFGRDFGHVRVHTGPQAADSARAVGARAYTVGDHVVFGAGEYAPQTADGLWLLAHELAHVAQGADGTSPDGTEIVVGPQDAYEAEADQAASDLLTGHPVRIGGHLPAPVLLANRRRPGNALVGMGVHAHRAIQRNFLIAAGGPVGRQVMSENRRTGGIPNASFSTQRALYNCGPEDHSSGLTGGRGHPDLAYLDGTTLEITEIKPASPECVRMGQQQMTNYVTKTLDSDPDTVAWRTANGVTNAVPMPTSRYTPPEAVFTDNGTKLAVTWAAPGVLTYSLFDQAALTAEDLANLQPPVTGEFRGGSISLYLPQGRDRVVINQVPGNDPALTFARSKRIELETLERETQHLYTVRATAITGTSAATGKFTFGKSFEFHLNKNSPNPRFLTTRQTVEGEASIFSPFALTIEPDLDVIRGSGPLRTTLPLLKNAPLFVEVDADRFAVVLRGDVNRISPGIPGLKVTQLQLAAQLAPDFAVTGQLGVAFGPVSRPYADGTLTISADANGLVAEGRLVGHIPGLDRAEGTVTYRGGQLTGALNLAVAQPNIPIPGVRVDHVGLTAGFTNDGFTVGGEIRATLPGNTPVTLRVDRGTGGRIVYSGEITLSVPRLDPLTVQISYDGVHLIGRGTTGFTFRGQRGTLTVQYRDGAVTGTGSLNLTIGKATGQLTVNLSESNRLSGRGELTYPLTEQLVGQLAVNVPEEGPVRATGGIQVTRPIQLFPGREGHLSFFQFRRTFPIPGLALPVIGGVVVEISAELGANYGIGPGTIESAALQGSVNLSEADPNPEVTGEARVRIPAHAGLTLSIDGGIGVGNDFVSATTGLNVNGEAGIRGGFDGVVQLAYRDRRFTVDASAAIRAGLFLTLRLRAYAQARAGIGPFQETFRKEWELAGFQWNGGGQVGVVLPVHYASNEEFRMPALSDIRTEPANLDAQGVLGQLFGRTTPADRPVV